MNILVTGGSGFLGGRLMYHLSRQHEVMACHDSVLDICKNGFAGNIDAAVHLVGLNDATCRRNPAHAYNVNVTGTHNLLNALPDKCKVIYFSTIHVYGYPAFGKITEETPVNPQSAYAMSHYLAEEMVLRRPGGTVLRLSNGFGCPVNFCRSTAWIIVVNAICKQAVEQREIILTIGENEERNFVTATDICRAVGHLLSSQHSGVFNVGSRTTTGIANMAYRVAERCQALFGYKPRVIINDRYCADMGAPLDYRTDKLRATGFTPLENYDEEINKLLLLVKENANEEEKEGYGVNRPLHEAAK